MTVLIFAVWISTMILIFGLMCAISYLMSEVFESFIAGAISFIVVAPIGILMAMSFGHAFGILG